LANTYQDFDNIQDILKEFYSPVIVNQAYKKAPLWAQLKKSSKGVVGKRVVIPVQLSFTEAVGARTQADYTLPDAARNTYDQAYIYMKRNYGVIKVDGFSIASAKGKGGWVDVVAQESKGASSAFGIDIDRQMMGDGSAVLGLSNAAASGQDIVVKSPGGLAGDLPATKYFRVGMIVDIYSAAFAAKTATAVRISAIAPSTNTLTFVGDITGVVAADHLITRKNTRTAADTTHTGEMMGIRGIVSDADPTHEATYGFQSIDRDTVEAWQSYVGAPNALVSETMIQETLDAIEQRTDADPPNVILTTTQIRNAIVKQAKTAYRTEALELKYGWKGIKYFGGTAELAIMTHKWVPRKHLTDTEHYMYFLSLPHIKFYTLKNLVWDTLSGGTLKGVAGEDTVTAWFKMYGEVGTDCPNSMGVLTDVNPITA